MKQIVHKLPFLTALSSFAILLVLLLSTDPSDNVTSILLVFLMIYICCSSLIYVAIHYGGFVVSRMRRKHEGLPDRTPSVRRSYYIASAAGFAPVCLLGMQSLGQLRPVDFLLVGFLTFIVVFYVIKRT